MAEPGRIAPGSLRFRTAVVSDIPALQRLYGQLVPDAEPSGDDMRDTLSRILADPDDGQIVVGDVDGISVATCQLVVYDNLVRTPYKKAMIDSVVVDADYRHRGIGSAMMDWSIAELRRRGCSKIIVATAHSRREAHEMYDKLGFDRFGLSFVMTCKGAAVPEPLRRAKAGAA